MKANCAWVDNFKIQKELYEGPVNASETKQVLEAALLTACQPLNLDDLLKLFAGRMERTTLRMLLDELKQDWAQLNVGKTLDLVQVATGYRFQARPQFSEFISRLQVEKPLKYSRAVMETLAIIACRQPVTPEDIEQIRGVVVNNNVMRLLQERDWIDEVGTREVPGRPSLYATTKQFFR